MTKTEKIANAQKRTDELQILMKCWNDSGQGGAKIVYAQKRISELQTLMKCWDDSEQGNAKIVNFPIKIENEIA